MLENILASFLNSSLGKYVHNLASENLEYSLLNGHLELRDLKLKPEALFELDLPIEVKAGHIGRISLDFSLLSLYSQPVIVDVEDVFILASPLGDMAYDPEREAARTIAIKNKLLAEIEKNAQESDSSDTPTETSCLIQTIVNNIKLSVDRVHIRYEDCVTNPAQPYACGVMMKSFAITTTDRQWNATDNITAGQTQINKIAHLHSLSFYWNPFLSDNNLISNKINSPTWITLMDNAISAHRMLEEDLKFCLQPISTSAKLLFNDEANITSPKLLADVVMDKINVVLSRQQYLNILNTAESFQMLRVNQRYRKYHPNVEMSGARGAKLWWKYAYNSTVQEVIRPYSWNAIKKHRNNYRSYKNLYKQLLAHPDATNFNDQLDKLSVNLDVANLAMAREQARLEFSQEAPDRVTTQPQSWWSWVTGGDPEGISVDLSKEIIITNPGGRRTWVDNLSNDDRDRLHKAIDYKIHSSQHTEDYVAHKVNVTFGECSVTLLNYSKEVLYVGGTNIMTSVEDRPGSHGFRISFKTESFLVEGLSVEQLRTAVVTSDIGVYAPSVTQVFSAELEVNPPSGRGDLALKVNIQPVEIMYDEHAVTEMLGFFHTSHMIDDMKSFATQSLSRMSSFSRAGLQYAIEQHKTLHLSVNMRSPYVVIPEMGTLDRGGNVLILDFGKLKIESELQPKDITLQGCSRSDLESRLYDKFNITISEVKVLLADSGDDWHTAQTQSDSELHLIPSVGVQIAFFNTIKHDYKQLPQQKIEGRLSTLKLHLSDEKLLMLSDFLHHVPFPQSRSMMGLDDVDGELKPIQHTMDTRSIQLDPDIGQLNNMRRSVRSNSILPAPLLDVIKKKKAAILKNQLSRDDEFYSASDHSDEDLEEWSRGFDVPGISDQCSVTNKINLLLRFSLAEVVVHISKLSDKIDTPYLMFRIDRLCVDAAKTVYGYSVQANLSGIQLVDKINVGTSGQYLELFSYTSPSDMMTLTFRQVSPDCPDFASIYHNTQTAVIVSLATFSFKFDRSAVLDLYAFFILGILNHLHSYKFKMDTAEDKKDTVDIPVGAIKNNYMLKMEELSVCLCDREAELADIQIRGLESKYTERRRRTVVQANVEDFSVTDLTENTLYPKILSINDDQLFDFKLTTRTGISNGEKSDGSFKLNVGRIQISALTKFVTQFNNFLNPFLNRQTIAGYKTAAQHTMHNKLQEAQEHGSKYKLDIHIRSPSILVPQNSESINVLMVKLGDLTIQNHFLDQQDVAVQRRRLSSTTEASCRPEVTGVKQNWDVINVGLEEIQTSRGKLAMNGQFELIAHLLEPFNMKLEIKRALPPQHQDVGYEFTAQMQAVQVKFTQRDLPVILAVLKENVQEAETLKTEKLPDDTLNLAPPTAAEDHTHLVEVEEPLLEDGDPSSLGRDVCVNFVMEGVSITLNDEQQNSDAMSTGSSTPGANTDVIEGLSQFELGAVVSSVYYSANKSMTLDLEVQSVTLDDIRPESSLAVKRIIMSHLPGRSQYKDEPMLTLNYKKDNENNQFLTLNIDTVRVNLCVPYLLTIYQYVMSACGWGPGLSLEEPQTPTTQKVPHPREPPPPETTPVSCNVSARFKQFEVALFADPTQVNSNVLVLKANSMADYNHHQGRSQLDVKVRQLQVMSGVYGLARHAASVVLFPCDIELSRVQQSNVMKSDLHIKVTDIYVHISATTIRTVLAVTHVLQNGMQRDFDESNSEPSAPLIQDLWTTTSITAEPWLDVPSDDDASVDSMQTSRLPENMTVNIPKIQVMFEIENLDIHVPRMCLKSCLCARVEDVWSNKMECHLQLDLELSYYNETLAVWEPLVEPLSVAEGKYRPWRLYMKILQGPSHPLECCNSDQPVDRQDTIDGEIHSLMLNKAKLSRTKADSSDSATDSDNEMTIIRPKVMHKKRHPSDRSYDSASFHGSVQGDSDSEPEELISALHSTLDNLLSSDSDTDSNSSEVIAKSRSHTDKPVFLTARGPVEADVGIDEVDQGFSDGADDSRCFYFVFDSRDKLNFNITPDALDVIEEIVETFSQKPDATVQSIYQLPGFEIHNELGIAGRVRLPKDLKVYEENLYNMSLLNQSHHHGTTRKHDKSNDNLLLQIDEVDGLGFIHQNLACMGQMLLNAGAFIYDTPGVSKQPPNDINLEPQRNDLHLQLEGFTDLCNLPHAKKLKKIMKLMPEKNETSYNIVYDVNVRHGRRVINLKSPLQFYNHLTVPVDLYCKSEELKRCEAHDLQLHSGDSFTHITKVDAHTLTSVPLYVAYHCKIYVAPADGYKKTTSGIWWKDLCASKDKHKQLICQPLEDNANPFQSHPFSFKVILEELETDLSIDSRFVPDYCIHLHAPIVLHNLLPYDIYYSMQSQEDRCLLQGETIPLYTSQQNTKLQLQILDYQGHDWIGTLELTNALEDFKAITMTTDSTDAPGDALSLSIHVDRTNALDLYVYSPYWVINKTTLPIQIRGSRSDVVYRNDSAVEPLLFRFKKHGRKKAKLRVYNSRWTRSFSLDTVASNGVVICNEKERNRKYQLMLQISFSKLHLTKIVTILPYFTVVNMTSHQLHYMEQDQNTDLWLNIGPKECVPFWPATDSMMMFVRHHDSYTSSQHFYIHRTHNTTLRMDNGTAIVVDVSCPTDSPVTISFQAYEAGDAPVKVCNLCEDVFFKLHQKNQSQVQLLSPNQCVLYTWDDPTAERTLMWNVYNRKKPSYPAFIAKDGFGKVTLSIQYINQSAGKLPSDVKNNNKCHESSDDDSDDDVITASPAHRSPLLRSSTLANQKDPTMNTRTDKVDVYWVSYLEKQQRVLLLTQHEKVANNAKKVTQAEQVLRSSFFSLSGVGLSLINSARQEVCYMSLSSAPARWLVELKGKYKHLSMEVASWLEQQWKQNESDVVMEDFIEADLTRMEMTKPLVGPLRRDYHPAVWVQFRETKNHKYMHTKVQYLQIDNQLHDAYFPTVLAPTPLPGYIVKQSGPKPFIELAVLYRQGSHTQQSTVKFCQVLIQEMNLKLDKGFLMSLYHLLACRQKQTPQSEQLKEDLNIVKTTITQIAELQAMKQPHQMLYEYLHLSPLKINMSFSLDGTTHCMSDELAESQGFMLSLTSDVLEFILKSVGGTLTEIREVQFKMAYFERHGVHCTTEQMLTQARHHYINQLIQQVYVLILGLDVLGNPYGLVKDFTQGLGDFFYEPFMASIEGPDKFTDSLVRGVHSLLGNTVGSVAGSVALISGSIGKTLATLSFDQHYKRSRHQRMVDSGDGLPHSLYKAGQGFVMGMVLGVTGVVTNPVRGACDDGVEGFFKGVGKGLLGLITKPTGGAVDMISMAFDGIRRSAELGDNVVVRARLPRFIDPENGLKPFSLYEAVGVRMLHSLAKGRYSDTDIYRGHATITKDEQTNIIIITDTNLFLVEKGRFWTDWNIEWVVAFEDLNTIPAAVANKVILNIKKSDGGLFNSETLDIDCADVDLAKWIADKIARVIQQNRT